MIETETNERDLLITDSGPRTYNARTARDQFEADLEMELQFQRPIGLTHEEIERMRWVKYGVALVVVATIVTVIDALVGINSDM